MKILLATVTFSLALTVAPFGRATLATPSEQETGVPSLPLRLSAFAVDIRLRRSVAGTPP